MQMKFSHLHIFKWRDVSTFINWFWIDVQITIQIVTRMIIRAFFVVRFFDVVVELFIVVQLIHKQIIHVDTIRILYDNHVVNMRRIIHINDSFDAFEKNFRIKFFFRVAFISKIRWYRIWNANFNVIIRRKQILTMFISFIASVSKRIKTNRSIWNFRLVCSMHKQTKIIIAFDKKSNKSRIYSCIARFKFLWFHRISIKAVETIRAQKRFVEEFFFRYDFKSQRDSKIHESTYLSQNQWSDFFSTILQITSLSFLSMNNFICIDFWLSFALITWQLHVNH
jgi:hypothetical protein